MTISHFMDYTLNKIFLSPKLTHFLGQERVNETTSQYRFRHEGNIDGFSRIHLPFYISTFDIAYIRAKSDNNLHLFFMVLLSCDVTNC